MPVRKIPIGNRAVTGLHARSGARYESSLERDFFELMTSDPAVAKVEEQPVQIVYTTSQGARRSYTPVSGKPTASYPVLNLASTISVMFITKEIGHARGPERESA